MNNLTRSGGNIYCFFPQNILFVPVRPRVYRERKTNGTERAEYLKMN
jgi:hypothetical protein